jgi:hypothetical protein
MSYSFDLSGSGDAREIALIRDEIDDVSASAEENGGAEGADYFVSDERIRARLANIEAPADAGATHKRLLAAASLLDTLATNQAYVWKKQRTLEQETDGTAVAAAIRAHATALRKRVEASLAQSRADAAKTAALNSEPCGGAVELQPVF